MGRQRAEAFTGEGYGRNRFMLFSAAKARIEECIQLEFYCEAVTIIESAITDRLESRLSFLKGENVGFRNLGALISEAKSAEPDAELRSLIEELDNWREVRNVAVHELVKIEAGRDVLSWESRIKSVGNTARQGYRLLALLYRRIADLNPLHIDRVF